MPKKSVKNTGITRDKKGQFVPGNKEGNRKGRPPKVKCIPDILKKIGEEEGTVDGKYTKLEVVMRKVYEYALKGKPWAVQFLADRTEGKSLQQINISEKPDEINIR